MKTQQIIPCSGWCYTSGDWSNGKLHVWNVAAWALMDDGNVIGLISTTTIARTERNVACLMSPPPIGGHYFLNGSEDDPRLHPPPPEIVPPDQDSLPEPPLSLPGY